MRVCPKKVADTKQTDDIVRGRDLSEMQAINERHLMMATSVLAIGQLLVSTNRCENDYINHSFMLNFCPTTTANCSHAFNARFLRSPSNRDGVVWLSVRGAWSPWWQTFILIAKSTVLLGAAPKTFEAPMATLATISPKLWVRVDLLRAIGVGAQKPHPALRTFRSCPHSCCI